MTENSSVTDVPRDRDLLLAQIREIYGRAAYTHKTHEKQADICFGLDRRQRCIKVALTAISSGAFLVSLFGVVLDRQWAALATSFIAVLVSAASLSDKTFQHGEGMQQHREAAAKFWNIRESYFSLIVDLTAQSVSVEQGRETRDRLQAIAQEAAADAPRTTPEAYARAQKALKFNAELTFSGSEIDHLLPAELRFEREVPVVSGK
ncbi:SLATT domain-containing protein [Cryobacterium sp. TmT2-59]|uniref:SLATT domain-containing protein n=1 Tax=Cryobacterium sp. TmT2-59 TaxID=1259264 RepID=UPI0018E0A16F|nr:SLATT domain-containing protein [Cryobacterium sp. TmT2-59]